MTPEWLTFLANHLWQSTLFAAAAGLTTVALRKNCASARYWIWLAASLKFLVPFSILVSLGSQVEWHRTPTPAPVVAPLPISLAAVEIIQPAASAPMSKAPSVRWRAQDALLWIWLSGFSIVMARWTRQWLRIRRAVRAATPLDTGAPIKVVSFQVRLEPGVFGIFRPVLLVPEGILDRLTPAQWRAILAHELCHARRRDNLTAAVHMAVEAIFWFYPLVWWIGKRLVAERERACDEAVPLTAGYPETYAEGILEVCKMYLESPLACVSGVTGSNLKKRIREIMSRRVAPGLGFAKKSVLAVAGLAALASPFAIGVLNAPYIRAQSAAAARVRFEVASIKRSTGCGASDNIYGALLGQSPGRLTLNCATVKGLILGAYGRYANGHTNFSLPPPILGGPPWIDSERYTINAKATGPENRAMMNGPMLQTLLEDRFKLKIHRQIRQVPVFALTLTKSGARLKPFQEGTCTPVDYELDLPPPAPGQPPFCQSRIRAKATNVRTVHVPGATVTTLSGLLSVILGRPVIDRTGIKGRFDFDMEFAIDQSTPGFVSDAADTGLTADASIFTAVQEQLGLKLESTKGPGEFLVIDHVERPSEN
jgi:bla regulator protein blaR1